MPTKKPSPEQKHCQDICGRDQGHSGCQQGPTSRGGWWVCLWTLSLGLVSWRLWGTALCPPLPGTQCGPLQEAFPVSEVMGMLRIPKPQQFPRQSSEQRGDPCAPVQPWRGLGKALESFSSGLFCGGRFPGISQMM